jgi:hypothetical protein
MAPEYAVLRNAISVDFEKILVGKLPVLVGFSAANAREVILLAAVIARSSVCGTTRMLFGISSSSAGVLV